MLFFMWMAAFFLGCLAQNYILADAIAAGLLLYLVAGTISFLAFRRCRRDVSFFDPSDRESPIFYKDIHWIPFGIGLLLAGCAIWLIWKASIIGFRVSPADWDGTRITYHRPPQAISAFFAWLGFVAWLAASVRRPFFRMVKKQSRTPLACLGILLLICFCLGIYQLTEVPVTVHGDEGMVGVHARKIVNGNIDTFFSVSWYSIPQFFYCIPAGGLYLFGDSLFGLRMSAVLMGMLCVIPFFFLARAFWGTAAAVMSAMLLIGNHFFLHLMHCGVHYVQATFFAVSLLCFWYGTNHLRSLAMCAASGLLLGFALLSYQANHILPVLWVVSQLWLLILRRIRFPWFCISTIVPLLITGLVIAPLIVHDLTIRGGTDVFATRAAAVGMWNPENLLHQNEVTQAGGDSALIWAMQLRNALLAPICYSDRSIQYGGDLPLLDRMTAVFFMLGLLFAGFHFFDIRVSIPALWILGILFAGGVLTIDPPFFPRLAGCLALLYVPVGGVFCYLLKMDVGNGCLRAAVIGFLVIVMGMGLKINLIGYFHTYADEISPRSVHYKQTRMAYFVAERGSSAFTYCFAGQHFSFGSGTVAFLANKCLGRDVDRIPARFPARPITIVLDSSQHNRIKEVQERLPNAALRRHVSQSGNILFFSLSRDGKE